jgi:2-polyprenyl-6-hydroxyphenyl methylase/3-demethylubiquinone-9 3-methyltransferase
MKIENIRPKVPAPLQREAYLKDVNSYKKMQKKFKTRNCPGCLSSINEFFSNHLSFKFSRCNACFTIFMNPGPTQEMVEQFYKNSSNYQFWATDIYPKTRESRRATIHRDRALFVFETIQKFTSASRIQKVLEIGAGTGDTISVLKELSSEEIEAYAIEPNLSMQNALRDNNINVVNNSIEISEMKFDVIMAFEVLEHFLSPDDFFLNYGSLLASEGFIIFSTPNAHSLEVQLLKGKSSTIDIEHISLLTPAAVHSIANRHGFDVEIILMPGKFDLELINIEAFDLDIVIGTKLLTKSEIQELISKFGFSSHMKVALSKKN